MIDAVSTDPHLTDSNLKVAIMYNPFNVQSIERHELVYNPDFTFADYLDGLPEHASYVIGYKGKALEKETWPTLKPEPGTGFSLVCVPEGGGGGTGKTIIRIVAMLAVVVAAAYFGPEIGALLGPLIGTSVATATAIAQGVIGVAGAMLVNAILPPTTGTAKKDSSSYGYDGPKNTSQEGVVVPVVYGTYRVAGNVTDMFTQVIGNDQYLFMRTILNDGLVENISDILVNNEDIANFSNIETRISLGTDDGAGNNWFGEAVNQVQQAAKIEDTTWITYTTDFAIDKVRLSLLFPGGLVKTHKSGDPDSPCSVVFNVQCKSHSAPDSSWAALSGTTTTSALSYTGGTKFLPGYVVAPLPCSLTGYAFKYSDVVKDGGALVDGATFTRSPINTDAGNDDVAITPNIITTSNPITGEDEYTTSVTLAAGVSNVTIEGMAELLTKTQNDLQAVWHVKAAYRPVGSSIWNLIGEDEGTVTQAASAPEPTAWSQFPIVYRTWSTPLNPDLSYEVVLLGGTLTSVTKTIDTTSTGQFTVTANARDVVRYDFESGVLANDFYDFRINRTNAEAAIGEQRIDQVYLQDVSEITLTNINLVGTANISLKIKMNDQLSSVPTLTALVQGCLVNQFDADGNILTNAWSQSPAWSLLDVLMNQNRGRGLSSSDVDFLAFQEWDAYCTANNITLNIIFDADSNIWDTAQTICRVGMATLSRIGTKWSIVIDQASEPVMLFNDSNIIEGTFQTDWLPLADRANEIQYTYYDASNLYQATTLRITDPDAPNVAAGLRVAQVTQIGVTNFDQAKADVTRQIRSNALLKKTYTFDSPLEAIGLTLGDVAAIQHTSANYNRGIGSGRLKPGSTTTVLNLDSPVTMTEGTTYSALVIHSALKMYDVTVTGTNSSGVLVTGLPDTVATVSRFVQGSVDIAIRNILSGDPADTIVADDTTGIVTGAAQLWATDVVEEKTVVYAAGPLTSVTLASAMLAVPDDYSVWMIGPVATVKQLGRLRSISGSSVLQRKLVFTQYDDQLYLPLSAIITPTQPPVLAPVAQVQLLRASYPAAVGLSSNTPLTLNWEPGDTTNYGGADVYSKLNSGAWTYQQSMQNVTTYSQTLNLGDDYQFRVVEFDLNSRRANANLAPTTGGVVGSSAQTLDPPTDLVVGLQSFTTDATVVATWTATDSTPIDGYRLQWLSITEDQYDGFLAETFTPDDSDVWNDAGQVVSTQQTFTMAGQGYALVQVRAEYGSNTSQWVQVVFEVDAPALLNRITGLTLENAEGDPINGLFFGKDAKFSWRDTAAQAQSLAASGADTSGLDAIWRDYQVQIFSPEGALLRTEITTAPYYVYTYEKNAVDNPNSLGSGVARREFTISVSMRGNQGQMSDPTLMDARNPPPDEVEGVIAADGNTLQLNFTVPADPDFAGMLVYTSTTEGFTPSSDNQVWTGTGTPNWQVPAATTYYVCWAGYDVFGTNELVMSPQVSTSAPGFSPAALSADLAAQINLITAGSGTSGSVAAQILAEATDRSDADAIINTTITGLTSTVNGNTAAINSEAVTRAAADSTMAVNITTLTSDYAANSSAITTEASTRAAADSTNATNITTLASYFGTGINGTTTVAALITSEATTRAAADSATATTISGISSTLGTNTAAIASEATTRATADTALSTSISTVSASVTSETSNRVSAIATEQTARISGDNALTTTTTGLQTQINTASSAITTEATTRASADSANASSISTLSTTVSGHTSSISSINSSVNGLESMAGVTINTDGHVTGWQLNNSSSSGSFIVTADTFSIYNGSGTLPAFTLTGGVLTLNVPLKINAVGTSNIGANAVSNATDNIIVTGTTPVTLTMSATDASSLFDIGQTVYTSGGFPYTTLTTGARLRITAEASYGITPTATGSQQWVMVVGYATTLGATAPTTIVGSVVIENTQSTQVQGGTVSWDFFTPAPAGTTYWFMGFYYFGGASHTGQTVIMYPGTHLLMEEMQR